ncbi:unnamed protein product, partial [Phaeothamnion confervicola]
RSTTRRVTNFEDLKAAAAAALPAAFVEELRLEDMPWPAQLEAFRRVDVLVGVFSAQMHNVMFLRPGSVVVLLVPPGF